MLNLFFSSNLAKHYIGALELYDITHLKMHNITLLNNTGYMGIGAGKFSNILNGTL